MKNKKQHKLLDFLESIFLTPVGWVGMYIFLHGLAELIEAIK